MRTATTQFASDIVFGESVNEVVGRSSAKAPALITAGSQREIPCILNAGSTSQSYIKKITDPPHK